MSVPATASYIAVAGTHGWSPNKRDAWWHPESRWSQHMRTRGLLPAGPRPFTWTTALNGLKFWRRWFHASANHEEWIAAGDNLDMYARACRLDACRVHIVTHSHGAQPALYAAAYFGLKIQTLTTVCAPVRADMQHLDDDDDERRRKGETEPRCAELARKHIVFWQHVYASDLSDRWQPAGGVGDGHLAIFDIQRKQPLADLNYAVPKIGHSGVLEDPDLFGVWQVLGDNILKFDGKVDGGE